MAIVHPDYTRLAARISVSNLHKQTFDSVKEVAERLFNYKDKIGRPAPLLAPDVFEIFMENHEEIQKVINFKRDFSYDYFGFRTLERSYLLKVEGKIVERPQNMLMRVSIGIHKRDLVNAFKTYNLMSELMFTHATPTLFNAGIPKP